MSATVEIKTSITIKPEDNGDVDVVIEDGGELKLKQGNDAVWINKAGSIALARIILQRHQISFEPIFIQEVDYTA
jgi:hypothetical protein